MGLSEAFMNTSPFLAVNQPCDQALKWTKEQLSQAGLHPFQTFDLYTARAGLLECHCPNHGTNECDCQMVVLLVYGKGEEPETLILHGNNGQTWLSLVENPWQKTGTRLPAEIMQALEKGPVITLPPG